MSQSWETLYIRNLKQKVNGMAKNDPKLAAEKTKLADAISSARKKLSQAMAKQSRKEQM